MKEKQFAVALRRQRRSELQKVMNCNLTAEKFGLCLSPEDAELLLTSREQVLGEQHRVEFSGGILPELINAFCDSAYIRQNTYVETLLQLQELFYIYKNESLDLLTDDELLTFMREQFDGVCCGSVEYLGETCLERFAEAVRAGYEGYLQTGGSGVYEQFTQEQHWDRELFLEVLKDLIQ